MTIEVLKDALAKIDRQDPFTKEEEEGNHADQHESPSSEISSFPFFNLPYDIRRKIYNRILFKKGPPPSSSPTDTGMINNGRSGNNHSIGSTRTRRTLRSPNHGNVGASSRNKLLAPVSHRLALFLANRRLHDEATQLFYSAQVFRIFPLQDYSRLPTLSNLFPTYRPLITTIELILGSSWTKPPKSWRVDERLGLRQLTRLRTLKVFVQCDPSHPLFEGFRVSSGFYTDYATTLLRGILEQLPNPVQVEFDAWPSVKKKGPLMTALLTEVRASGKNVLWGPERGWKGAWDEGEEEEVEKKEEDGNTVWITLWPYQYQE